MKRYLFLFLFLYCMPAYADRGNEDASLLEIAYAQKIKNVCYRYPVNGNTRVENFGQPKHNMFQASRIGVPEATHQTKYQHLRKEITNYKEVYERSEELLNN